MARLPLGLAYSSADVLTTKRNHLIRAHPSSFKFGSFLIQSPLAVAMTMDKPPQIKTRPPYQRPGWIQLHLVPRQEP